MCIPVQSNLQRGPRSLIPKNLADRIASIWIQIVLVAEDTGGGSVINLLFDSQHLVGQVTLPIDAAPEVLCIINSQKERKRPGQVLSEIIGERKEKGLLEKDLLGHLLNFKDGTGQTLTEDQIADNIIGVLFTAQGTTASVLTWILKYLHDGQKLLEAVKAEQKAIYESNEGGKNAFLLSY
ncbi:cytochrome P450, family 707, subfamily A, polypeptide 4 [Actinidia rufa]|uniref:Cytochrome P450, family 707, subfamily A, polypeptide 4 n=1 Tax=Actinidia rufa TaxID=165716 RepID=A0A7J0E1L1_9ERIC|nr:cytochrome P450, family 707, subfamily A, polypeptide 4 [Actinidia rufa]